MARNMANHDMLIVVTPPVLHLPDGRRVSCAVGRSGLTSAKREGDGATPVGIWPLRRVLYRPDRLSAPQSALPVMPIAPDDGWCDDPGHPSYNRPVTRPFAAGHERLWRDDALYDVIVILGHNDRPPVAGAGSAIFLHLARPDFGPTEGCVAIRAADMAALLQDCGPHAALDIRAEGLD